MKSKILLTACFTSLLFTGLSFAAEEQKPKKPPLPPKKVVDLKTKYTANCKPLGASKAPEKRPFKTVPEGVFKRLNKALELLGKEDAQGALDILKGLYERNKGRPYLKALLALNLGNIYINLNQNAQAMRYFEIALNEKKLQITREQSARRALAQYSFIEEDYDRAIKLMTQWFSYEVKPKTGYTLLAAIYAQKGELKKAICPAYIGTQVAKSYSKSDFSIMVMAHNELKDKPGTIKLASAMVEVWPDEVKYWRTLSSLYANSDNFKTALAVSELMHRKGMFSKKDDYLLLSSLYANNVVPYKAAEVLEEGIKAGLVDNNERFWKSTAQNWHAASELAKAVKAYGEAAKHADNGDHYVKQGELLTDLGRLKEAVKAFDTAIAKGALKDVGKVYYKKGLAQYDNGNLDLASNTLSKALKYKKWKKRAGQWMNEIKRRKVTLEELAAN